jgi:hypothetical protein
VVGLPLILVTKVEVKVVRTRPLERDVGGDEEDGGFEEVGRRSVVVDIEREGEEVVKSVEKRVLV